MKSSRRNKPRSLALLGAGAAAAAPLAIQAAQQYGPTLIKELARRWRENEGPVRRRVRARRARRQAGNDDKALVTPSQVSQVESSGMQISSTAGQAMIPRPVAMNNRRGKWKAGTNGPRICKSEFITVIDGSVAFTRQSMPGYPDGAFRINPGLEYSFPWLSGIANGFESYKFHSLRLHYIPTTNLNATGNLYMTPIIDPQQSPPVSNRELLSQFMDVVDTNVKTGATCSFPLGRKTEPFKWRFVRNNPTDATSNLEAYDMGYFLFDRGGCADTTVQGELWVDYDIELFNPRFRGANNRVEGGKIFGNTAISAANPFGTAPIVDTSSLGFSVNSSSVVTFFNPASFLAVALLGGTNPTLTPTTVLPNTVTSLIGTLTNAAGTFSVAAWLLDVNDPQQVFTFTGGGTVTSSSLWLGTAPASSLTLGSVKKTLTDKVEDLENKLSELLNKKDAPKFVYLPAA